MNVGFTAVECRLSGRSMDRIGSTTAPDSSNCNVERNAANAKRISRGSIITGHSPVDVKSASSAARSIRGTRYQFHIAEARERGDQWTDERCAATLPPRRWPSRWPRSDNRRPSSAWLEFEPTCVEFYKTERSVSTASSEQVRRPIFLGGLFQWRNYEPWLGPLKDKLDDALIRYRE